MPSHLPDLLRTKIEVARVTGVVEEHPDHLVIRTPSNPGFYHGNFFVLAEPPQALAPWVERFEETYGPDVRHVTLVWDGADPSAALLQEAKGLGLHRDVGCALVCQGPPKEVSTPELAWSVRQLDLGRDADASRTLGLACDPAEQTGDASYREFKTRFRESNYAAVRNGDAAWWGAFDGEQLIAQLGFMPFGELGRYRAVETHPDFRRRGVCSALVSHVGRHAVEQLGVERLVIEADVSGPAVGLYRRLGFEDSTTYQCLVRTSGTLEVRREVPGEATEVRSILLGAFDGPGEANLVERLRDRPDVHAFVALESGHYLGHVFYTPVRVAGAGEAWEAIALGPMAVRADARGRGVGTRLMEASLATLAAEGHEVCFVLGHPTYYPRVGFVPAPPLGLTCTWSVPDEVFMVKELVPGALAARQGLVSYDAAFDEL